MNKETVLIISNYEEVSNNIAAKIKFLREYDNIKIVSYIEAISVLNTTQPSVIIVYCHNFDSINIVKEIRTIKSLNKVPIILAMDKYDEEKLLFAYDKKIDDFFFLSDPDSVILMRVLFTIQKSILYKQLCINNEILVSANIYDNKTGIIKKEQAENIFKIFFTKSIEENMEDTIFMYVKPLSINGKKLNLEKISEVVKSIPRANDIISYGKDSGFYIILYNSGLSGAKSVAERIKNRLNNICNIYANAAQITISFEEMEEILYQSMKDQIQADIFFNFIQNISITESSEVIQIKDENGKSFKSFKTEFAQNFEMIINPIFEEIQNEYKNKFPNALMKYAKTENEILFTISQDTVTSKILLTYPTYMKLIIDIEHKIKEKEQINKRILFDFSDFSEDDLKDILIDFINKFSEKIASSKNEISENNLNQPTEQEKGEVQGQYIEEQYPPQEQIPEHQQDNTEENKNIPME